MSEPQEEPEQEARVGRARTWWHPLFTRVLDWLLKEGYVVQGEVPVGVMPLQIDILLLLRESGAVSAWAERYLPELLARLRRRTLVEFKGPTDSLQAGDWEVLMAYAALYLQQEPTPLTNEDLSLIFIAPSLTASFRERLALRQLTLEAEPGEPGIHRIVGGMFETWVLETDEMARRRQPIFTLFSRTFLRERRRIIQEFQAAGNDQALWYVSQQIQQFRQSGEEWIMQFPNVDEMEALEADLRRAFVETLTAEERLDGLSPEKRLEGLSPEKRLEGLSPEQVLQAFSPEQVLQAFSPEERRRLKQLLEQQDDNPPQAN